MFVTITSLQLRSRFGFFALSLHGLKISLQAKKQKGFIAMKNTGKGYLHFTLSGWQNEVAIREFARSGAHLEAMKTSKRLAREIRVYTFETETLPDWKTAQGLLLEHGKILTY